MRTKENPLGIAPFDPAEHLKSDKMIAEFLNASLEMNDSAVMLNALNTVARARGMTRLANDSGLGRENLYNALKPGAKPRFDTVVRVMDALGVQLYAQVKDFGLVEPKKARAGAGKATARPAKPRKTREHAAPAAKDARKRPSR